MCSSDLLQQFQRNADIIHPAVHAICIRVYFTRQYGENIPFDDRVGDGRAVGGMEDMQASALIDHDDFDVVVGVRFKHRTLDRVADVE